MNKVLLSCIGLCYLFFNEGCCYDNDCISEVGVKIELANYPDGDYPILIERYIKNNIFDSLVDSYTASILVSNTGQVVQDMRIGNRPNETDLYDYRCILLTDSNSFEITQLSIDRDAKDRKCGLYKTMEGYVCPYKSINVVGAKASENNYIITLSR